MEYILFSSPFFCHYFMYSCLKMYSTRQQASPRTCHRCCGQSTPEDPACCHLCYIMWYVVFYIKLHLAGTFVQSDLQLCLNVPPNCKGQKVIGQASIYTSNFHFRLLSVVIIFYCIDRYACPHRDTTTPMIH